MNTLELLSEIEARAERAAVVEGRCAGFIYGLANCSICGEIDNDYHFSEPELKPVCLKCWKPYVHAPQRPVISPGDVAKLVKMLRVADVALELIDKLTGQGEDEKFLRVIARVSQVGDSSEAYGRLAAIALQARQALTQLDEIAREGK